MFTDIGKAFAERVLSGSLRPTYKAIHERPSFTQYMKNALNHHTHYYSVREFDTGLAVERYVEMTCACGDKVRLFIPPLEPFSGLEKYVNTGYVPDNG